ncbi:hypothetical protein [Jeotgalibacillus haloalkalitolerans]|uniref:Uncharacterized protein n=1 Tax=Jeotgalibacillus haloalkalitolerans TaxID=3104292 RepID=A0ABU5KKD2_9BACL|nr:hypothetical protein [Jeotgalibacillus sp. HH7-29]MDZ5711401.1 hypothetical protein [Jeotgalibacillus sp. HH7-29]
MGKFEEIEKRLRVLKLAHEEGLLQDKDLNNIQQLINELFVKLSQPESKRRDYSALLEEYDLEEEDLSGYYG